MILIRTFINNLEIRMYSEMVEENPNFIELDEKNKWQAHHYKCFFKQGRRQMTTYFSMGIGLSREPNAEDVLDCLAVDSSSVIQASNFEEWAYELDYNPDSRKAEKIFNICQKQNKKLKQFLGKHNFNKLLYEVERL